MIGTILKHEWRILVADWLLHIIVPLFAVLIGYGVFNGVSWVEFQKATLAKVEAHADRKLAELRSRSEDIEAGRSVLGNAFNAFTDPRNPAPVSRGQGFEYASMAPSPMAALSMGQSDLYPYYTRITRQSLAELATTDEIENPANLAAGRFDVGFVFTFLYPLLILALSYNILSAEKEQGTQSILLSQPVSVRQFVTGKILLRGIVMLGTALALSLIGFALGGGLDLSSDALWRLALWIVLIAGYGVFWLGLAIGVNAFGKRSSTNALVLIGAWLLFVILLPALISVAGRNLYPVPSRIVLVQAERAAQADISRVESQLTTKLREDDAALSGNPLDENEEEAAALSKLYRDALLVEEKAERSTARLTARFSTQMEAQQRLARRLRFLSPAILAQMAMNELAGTSVARYRHYERLVKDYHRRWRGFFDPKILAGQRLTVTDYDKLPRFQYVEEPRGAVMTRALEEIVPLLVLGSLTALIGFGLLRRYPLTG